MLTKLKTAALALALIAPLGAANANTVTFSGVGGNNVAQATYTEDGFTFTSIDGNFWGWPSPEQLHLDPSGFNNSTYDITFSGGAFTVQSFDVSYAGGTPNSPALFASLYDASNNLIGSGAIDVSTTGTLTNPFSTLAFGRIRIQSTSSHFSLDNFVGAAAGAGAVPEPATWAMMLTGFGLVGAAARRRKSALAAA